MKNVRICLDAVYVSPYRAFKGKQVMAYKPVNEATAEAARELTVEDAKPLKDTAYLVQLAKAVIKRTILACA